MYPILGWNYKAFRVVVQEIYAADKKFTRPPVPLVPPNINSVSVQVEFEFFVVSTLQCLQLHTKKVCEILLQFYKLSIQFWNPLDSLKPVKPETS